MNWNSRKSTSKNPKEKKKIKFKMKIRLKNLNEDLNHPDRIKTREKGNISPI